ncbi:MAG: hypothetical protein HRT61_06815 [Ekhidna sp.]|nr:hypothetical protein [Ekhidna sp.]
MTDRLKGWFAVERKSITHPFFKRSERSEYEAWLWLIAHAAWEETNHWVNGKRHEVKRGELFTTLRELQSEWMWSSDKKVRGFLKRLNDERMIDAETSRGKTQITICNYSLYQDIGRKKDAETSEKNPNEGQAKDALKEQNKQINNISSSFHSEDNNTPLPPSKPKGEQSKSSSRGTRLSAEWVLSDDDFQFGLDLGFEPKDIRFMADGFKDYWLGASGAKATKKDWPATWRNWVRRKYEDGQKKSPQQFQRKTKVSEMDILDSFKTNQGTFQ